MTKKQLQAKWNKILADEGLPDIEDSKGRLKRWHSWSFHHLYTPEEFANRLQYYDNCAKVLNYHTFKSERDRMVWKLYSEGYTMQCIADSLELPFDKRSVHKIIKRIKKRLGWSK